MSLIIPINFILLGLIGKYDFSAIEVGVSFENVAKYHQTGKGLPKFTRGLEANLGRFHGNNRTDRRNGHLWTC